MNAYDKKKVGKLIAKGGDARVFLYRENKVIKFSTLSRFLRKRVHEKLVRDYQIAKEYFGEYIVDTEHLLEKEYHIEIQDFIQGRPLHVEEIEDDERIRKQCDEIRIRMRKMENDGYPPLDLVGNNGLFRSQFGNIFVDSEKQLHIIDVTLLEGESLGLIGFFFSPLIEVVKWYQRKLIRKCETKLQSRERKVI